jgi:8-oxo-dGTP pyrophosphatase MutT (NUDIX family)
VPSLAEIRSQLAGYKAQRSPVPERPPNEAAVALVLHEPTTGGPELLFIERARREGDPWSGQMAFPGGRREGYDLDLQVTAARETHEEVGVTLSAPVGQLDDFAGTRNPQVRPLVVAPYVYVVEERPPIVTNHEVADTVWVPLSWMLDPASAIEYRFEHGSYQDRFPALQYDRFTIWGLTYRVLGNFLDVLGERLPGHPDVRSDEG